MSNPLRNPNIDYTKGWFFITIQVEHNKSIFGAIAGEACELTELGRAIQDAWRTHPDHTPGLYCDTFVVMPNHFHAIVKLQSPGAVTEGHEKTKDLSQAIGQFKSYTNHLYLQFKEEKRCVDIGPRLWQDTFYDNLITEHQELVAIRTYIQDNPKNWNRDRFGPVTTYTRGNPALLNEELIAFIASETPPNQPPATPTKTNLVALDHCAEGLPKNRTPISSRPPVISTFTSAEERAIREKCLRLKRPFIWICPGGIWNPLPHPIAQACDEGWALICSPVPSKTGVNKQRANWCNHYILQHAKEIWHGTIRPGGSLETLLKTVRKKEST